MNKETAPGESRPKTKLASTKGLWAAIRVPECGKPWIHWDTVALTRKKCRQKLLEKILPEKQTWFLQGIRFARVTITEEPKP